MPQDRRRSSLVAPLEAHLARLQSRAALLERRQDAIGRERDALVDQIGQLEQAVRHARAAMGLPIDPGSAPPPPGPERRRLARGRPSIADAAAEAMMAKGEAMPMLELLGRLQADGRVPRTRGAYATVFRSLSKEPERFYRPERGVWALSESPAVQRDLDRSVIGREIATLGRQRGKAWPPAHMGPSGPDSSDRTG